VAGLRIDRGRGVIVNDVSFRASPGQTVLLNGPSGAGKTSIIAVLAGQIRGRAGQVRVTGNELRASGQPTARPEEFGPASLTPQQVEIAALAATGLTNKEIGQRLYLSHRTVGAHLYRIFPKLGISSRAALADALRPLQSSGRSSDFGWSADGTRDSAKRGPDR